MTFIMCISTLGTDDLDTQRERYLDISDYENTKGRNESHLSVVEDN